MRMPSMFSDTYQVCFCCCNISDLYPGVRKVATDIHLVPNLIFPLTLNCTSMFLLQLNLLQEHHEAEMDRLIADHMTRHSSSRIADLQGQLSTQQIVISHLKDQLKQ